MKRSKPTTIDSDKGTEYREDQQGLYLIGSRNVKSFIESNESELDGLANEINAPRPRLWDAVAEKDAIEAMMLKMRADTPGFEGFVFRDRGTGDRIKVKDPEYIKWCHMLDQISYKRLVPLYMKGEAEDVIAYFPTARKRIERIEQKVQQYLDHVVCQCRRWRDRARNEGLNRKRLAAEISVEHKDKFMIRQIMAHFEQENDDVIYQEVKTQLWRMGGAQTEGAQYKRFVNLVRLTEDQAATSDV